MTVSYGDISSFRNREIGPADVRVRVISAPVTLSRNGSSVICIYSLESDKLVTASNIELQYSTDNAAWNAAAADAGDPLHEGTTNLSADADGNDHTFVWDSLTDLGAALQDNTIWIRVRAQDASSRWSTYLQSLQFEIDMLPTITVTAPSAGSENGSKVHIDYNIASLLSGVTFTVEAEYSTNSGGAWSPATALGADPAHDGVSGLSTGNSTFVWDTDTDLGISFQENDVQVRVRANNGTAWGGWSITSDLSVDMIPSCSTLQPVSTTSEGSPVQVQYRISTNRFGVTQSVTVEYTTNDADWFACTADAADPRHDTPSGLAAGTYEFIWDSAIDLTTAFQSTSVKVRTRSNDGTNNSPYAPSPEFEIDMLPGQPSLVSPFDTFFDADTTPDLVFTIPTDPGSDRMVLRVEIDDDETFVSPALDHNSQDNLDRFMHEITIATGLKEGANGAVYYVREFDVTAAPGSAQAVTFASLTDFHKETAVPTTLTNPQVLLLNRADRRCFIPAASITGTGFDIYKSVAGNSTDGKVDLIIFAGAVGVFETYWVDLTVSGDATYTYGVTPFDIDVLGRTIPGSISFVSPEILEGNDAGVYMNNIVDTGFQVHLSSARIAATATVRVCLRQDPSETYQHANLAVINSVAALVDFDSALDDQTNGGAAWPDYLPGAIVSMGNMADRQVITSVTDNDSVALRKSVAGIDDDGLVTIRTYGENDSSRPFFTNIPPLGVVDTFEGGNARYRVVTADALAQGGYFWRARAGNIV